MTATTRQRDDRRRPPPSGRACEWVQPLRRDACGRLHGLLRVVEDDTRTGRVKTTHYAVEWLDECPGYVLLRLCKQQATGDFDFPGYKVSLATCEGGHSSCDCPAYSWWRGGPGTVRCCRHTDICRQSVEQLEARP